MEKKFNLKTGKMGEDIAEKFLKKKEYEIVLRNFKTKYSEIDMIVKKNNCLIFVEIRTRTGDEFGLPEETIRKEKKNRLIKAAQAFVAFNNWQGSFRIDAVCIILDRKKKVRRLNHYKNITSE